MLDMQVERPVYPGQQGSGASLDTVPMPSGSRSRWHCASTQSQQEYRALSELLAQGFAAYLPLHLDRCREVDRIIPLFSGYIFVAFDPECDPWGKIQHTRGVWSLIMASPSRPRSLPVGVIEDLIARTSERRVVNDPGPRSKERPEDRIGARWRVTEGHFEGWEGVCTLSGPHRVRLLMSLFGGGAREIEFKAGAVEAA